jgi:amino acid adenylation domain-containing protein
MQNAMSLKELRQQVRDSHIRLWVSDRQLRYSAPQGAMTDDIRVALGQHKADLIAELASVQAHQDGTVLIAAPQARHDPFPMTDLQQAYWVGEHGSYAQSAIPCFFHQCRFDQVDGNRLQTALEWLQHRHEVLRSRFLPTGMQVIPPPGENLCRLGEIDLRGLEKGDAKARLAELCDTFPETLPSLERGPPFAATLVRMNGSDRLLLVLRLIAIDGPSLSMIFRDLLRYLFDADATIEAPTELSYRDYVVALNNQAPAESRAYWDKVLPALPPPPDLPVTGQSPLWSEFRRLSGKLDAATWQKLKAKAAQHGVTANAAMLGLYAAVLRPWAQHPAFTLNVLANYRPFTHPDLAAMTGNCSNTTLIDCDAGGSFAEQVIRIQDRMAERLAHAGVSGVSLLRQLQQRGGSDSPASPFVFTSGISSARPVLPPRHTGRFELVDSHLRTPQVWMDHQVIENHEGLIYYWDYVRGIFEEGVSEAIFERYQQALDQLIENPSAWHRPDPAEASAPLLAPLAVGQAPQDQDTLAALFLAQVARTPGNIALVPAGGEPPLTYRQLSDAALESAAALQALGLAPGNLVSIQMNKSARQIIAVIAASLAGLVWLPLDARLPAQRRNAILTHSACRWLITEDDIDLPPSVRRIDPASLEAHTGATYLQVERQAGDRAYVIYTSGSTGQPKGVVITHGAVCNTLTDINRRFGIVETDRVLALSALSFDLSVYDIWGTLAVGAAIVLPQDSEFPDPQSILERCATQRVTVWNSVPALLDMALAACGSKPCPDLVALRVVMLSGDWIPLSLASTVLEQYPQVSFFSLGGATEASIWSNYFPVTAIEPGWRSIPYGFALAGQQLHVLDEKGNPCRPWVRGEIHIEGHGLAQEYLGDTEKTAQSFTIHRSGRRLYKTGDLGLYRADGAIEFLGRKDFQMKIRGYRIEAGDIEAHLATHPKVTQAQALAIPDRSGGLALVACYTGETTSHAALAEWLSTRLPHYMVPDHFLPLDSFPLSANGKRDRKALTELAAQQLSAGAGQSAAFAEAELRPLAELWGGVTGRMPASGQDHFFHSGGSSLLAVHLASAIRTRFGVDLRLAEIFQGPRLCDIWAMIAKHAPARIEPANTQQKATS